MGTSPCCSLPAARPPWRQEGAALEAEGVPRRQDPPRFPRGRILLGTLSAPGMPGTLLKDVLCPLTPTARFLEQSRHARPHPTSRWQGVETPEGLDGTRAQGNDARLHPG